MATSKPLPHLETITDRVELEVELRRRRREYSTVGLHASIGDVPRRRTPRTK